MAKVNWRIVGHESGIEKMIEGFGTFYMVIGISGAIIFGIVFFKGESTTMPNGLYSTETITVNNPLYLGFALASLLSAFFPFALLKGLAELLRVQKKAANLSYAGILAAPLHPIKYSYCDNCGEWIRERGRKVCPNCKEPLEWPTSTT